MAGPDRILGHASFATTMKLYGGLTAEALESAAGTPADAFEPKPAGTALHPTTDASSDDDCRCRFDPRCLRDGLVRPTRICVLS